MHPLAVSFSLKVKCPSVAEGIAVTKKERVQSGIARTSCEQEAMVLHRGLELHISGLVNFINVICVTIALFANLHANNQVVIK